MTIKEHKNKNSKNLFNLIFLTITLFAISVSAIKAQGFNSLIPIEPVTATAATGEKPQSKVWFYQGYWFTIIPVSGGTYVYRLDGNIWTQLIQISSQTLVKADVKLKDTKTYILLKDSRVDNSIPQIQNAELITIDFQAGSPPTYIKLTSSSIIPLDNYSETATIDIGNNGRMWLASDGGGNSNNSGVKNIFVRWSDPPYNNFSAPITIAAGVNYDDICAVTSFSDNEGSKIGVIWSNQSDQITNEWRFGFKYHLDGNDVYNWSADELTTYGDGGKFADDHINFAVQSDGTIYAVVKTGYDGQLGMPQLALLVRRPNGTWDPAYKVTDAGNSNYSGTRPIVILDESTNMITVIYTEKVGGNDIVYKDSPTSPISFPSISEDIIRSDIGFNDVSCAKDIYSDEVVIIYSEQLSTIWHGVIAEKLPPFIPDINNGAGLALRFDGINDRLDFNQNSSLNLTGPITIEAWINPSTFTGRGYIVEKYINTLGGYDLGFQNVFNANYVSFRIGSGASISQINSSVIPLNVWTHIAAVYDGSTIKIYLNGALNVSANAITSITNSGTNLIIGANNSGTGIQDYFDGSMDEVRLWNVARTESQIRENMCRKLTGAQPDVVGYWAFDKLQVSGTSVSTLVHDYNNLNNGTRTNFASTIPGGYEWSGASVGDESSYDYDVIGGYTQTLTHPDGDFIEVVATGGTLDGIQLYYTNVPALNPAIPELGLSGSQPAPIYNITDTLRYWGVKAFGSTSNLPTYTLTYHYQGHPDIINENDLNLIYRDNLSDNSWEDLVATLDISQNTLTKTGLTETEFALAYSQVNSITVMLKAFLEGPYNGSGMNTGLNTFLPNLQPYNIAPWDYAGSENVAADFFSTHTNIVDWILVELRTGTSSATSVGTRAALLKNDGTIVDLDGSSPIVFTGLSAGSYYIVVHHRNHLAVMSANLVALSESSSLYDFTTAQTQAYGINPMTNFGDGKFGMVSGDGNANGSITASDNNTIWLPQFLSGEDGYKSGDYNLSGSVTASDNNSEWLVNNGKDSQVPQ